MLLHGTLAVLLSNDLTEVISAQPQEKPRVSSHQAPNDGGRGRWGGITLALAVVPLLYNK